MARGASADIVVERVAALKELGYRNIRVQAGGYGGGKGAQIHKPENPPKGAYFDPKAYYAHDSENDGKTSFGLWR